MTVSDERALRDALELAQTNARGFQQQLEELRHARASVDEQLQRALDEERARVAALSREADQASQLHRELERERTTNEHLRAELISLRQEASRTRVTPRPADDTLPQLQQALERHAAVNAQLQNELTSMKNELEQSTQRKELLRLQNEVTGLRNQLAFGPSKRSQLSELRPSIGVSPAATALLSASVLVFFAGELASFSSRTEAALVLFVAAVIAQFAGRRR